jgi:hypothetical protein
VGEEGCSARPHSPDCFRAVSNGIFIAEYERGDIGGDLFRGACNVGVKGIISKQSDRVYGPSKCKH